MYAFKEGYLGFGALRSSNPIPMPWVAVSSCDQSHAVREQSKKKEWLFPARAAY